MKYLKLFFVGLILAVSSVPGVHAQKAPQTLTDQERGALTFSSSGFAYKGPDGTVRKTSAAQLNVVCSEPSKLVGEMADVKPICADQRGLPSEAVLRARSELRRTHMGRIVSSDIDTTIAKSSTSCICTTRKIPGYPSAVTDCPKTTVFG